MMQDTKDIPAINVTVAVSTNDENTTVTQNVPFPEAVNTEEIDMEDVTVNVDVENPSGASASYVATGVSEPPIVAERALTIHYNDNDNDNGNGNGNGNGNEYENENDDNDNASVITSTTEGNGVRDGHSLPTVEQVRIVGAVTNRSKNVVWNSFKAKYTDETKFRRRVLFTIGWIILVVVTMVGVGIIVGIQETNNNNSTGTGMTSSSNANNSKDETTNIGNHPNRTNSNKTSTLKSNTTETIARPSPHKFKVNDTAPITNNTETTLDRFQKVVYLLGVHEKVSLSRDMETIGSPQYHATWFMANDDRMFSTIPKYNEPRSTIEAFVQRYVAAVFYYSLNGPDWTKQYNFMNGSTSVCNWNGLFKTNDDTLCGMLCNGDDETTITDIILPSNNLVGTIPEELGLLSSLESISMYNNHITDFIEPKRRPNEEDMNPFNDTLYFIQLGKNNIAGSIPDWFFELSMLEFLGLSNNALTGSIPVGITSLFNLQELDLSHNTLTGTLDALDGFMCPFNLTLLYVQNNSLSVTLYDDTFSYCESLKEIDLSYNSNITGELYSHFYSLNRVNLQGNSLTGPIKNATSSAPSTIEYLNLAGNQLTGPIPSSIGMYLQDLKYLDLSYNKLKGSLSEAFGSTDVPYGFEFLILNNNNFDNGPIPDGLKYTTNLTALVLSNTNLVGSIPTWVGTLDSMSTLDLHSNKLTKQIPSELGEMQSLKYLLLNNNLLTGVVPESFNNVDSQMEILYLDHNSVTGNITVCTVSDNFPSSRMITADCLDPSPEVVCDCCRTCCYASNSDTASNDHCSDSIETYENTNGHEHPVLGTVLSELSSDLSIDQEGWLYTEIARYLDTSYDEM